MDLSILDSLPSALQLAATERDLVTGQVLFHRQDEAQFIFVVQTGRLRLVRYTSEGKLVILQVVRAGEGFAESALFSEVYDCDAIVEMPSRVIVYPKPLLLTVLREQPDLAENFINRLARKNQSLKDRLELQSIRSARDRVLQVATQPTTTVPDYAAAKAAMVNLTVSLTKELAGTGITVNTVSPGTILTSGLERAVRQIAQERGWGTDWAELEKRTVQEIWPNPTGRVGRVKDIATFVTFVASPLAGFINGANLRVDGGNIASIN